MVHVVRDLNTVPVNDPLPIPSRITVTACPPFAARSQGWDDFPVVMECLTEQCIPSSRSKELTVEMHPYKPNDDDLFSTVLPNYSSGMEETITIIPSPLVYQNSFDRSTFPLNQVTWHHFAYNSISSRRTLRFEYFNAIYALF